MDFHCEICKHNFVTKWRLKRHKERKNPCKGVDSTNNPKTIPKQSQNNPKIIPKQSQNNPKKNV